MKPVLSRELSRAFDREVIDQRGVPGVVLMENAGRGVVDAVEREWPSRPPRTSEAVVVAGLGNNGGDGFVVARHWVTRGGRARVFVTGPRAKVTGDAKAHLSALAAVGVEAEELEGDISTFREALSRASFVVDAVFGTGLSRAIDGRNAVVLEAMQEAKRPIVAVDVPSGLDADTGARLGVAIKADLTVTFVAHKLGLLTPRGAELAGKVVVTDIGVPPPSVGQPGGSSRAARLLERSDVAALVTPRALGAHKNAAGHVVVLAGSAGHVGAAVMCAHGAFRAGAGLVTIATWPEAAAQIEGRATEVMTARLAPERLEGSLDDVLSRATVVVVGPGFGKDERAKAAVRHVLASWGGPSVVDADALAMFAGDPDVFASAKGATILTPHPGELGVLLGVSARDIEADRFLSLASCVSRARSVTLLKGAHTLVGAPGETPVVNASGTPALATAGSGDVLSGTIAAMACTLEPFEAAFVGAHLHGLGAEAWSERHGDRGLLAHEIADEYPGVMRQLLRVERA